MHIGNRIRDILTERGQSVVWLARQLSYSRTNIYKLFDKSTIDTGVLLRISIILHYDFFVEYSNEIKARQK
nr:XRE family transcriptional regulator [Barnesiella viscericola]